MSASEWEGVVGVGWVCSWCVVVVVWLGCVAAGSGRLIDAVLAEPYPYIQYYTS